MVDDQYLSYIVKIKSFFYLKKISFLPVENQEVIYIIFNLLNQVIEIYYFKMLKNELKLLKFIYLVLGLENQDGWNGG